MAGAVRPPAIVTPIVPENDVDSFKRQNPLTEIKIKRSCSKFKNLAFAISRLLVIQPPTPAYCRVSEKWAECESTVIIHIVRLFLILCQEGGRNVGFISSHISGYQAVHSVLDRQTNSY